MRIAWLLLTRSGRSSWNRLSLTAAAVALGMLMLLVFAAGINALNARSSHSSWRYDIFLGSSNQKPVANVAPLKAKVATDGNLNKLKNENITTVSLRATGENSPQIHGLLTPKEGEYYISQGLSEAMRSDPETDIGTRFGKKQIGIIPKSLSTSPDSLEVIRGMSEQEASGERVTELYQFRESGQAVSTYSGLGYILLGIGAIILLFPIVVFISIATQLGSAQREKRYAALRLIGATRRQVSRIMAIESLSAASAGIVIGSLAYLAILPLMSQYYFDDMRFYASDLTVPISQYVFMTVLVLLFCLLANWWGMRHVHISPLGVACSGKISKHPRAWRSILLLPGVLLFAWFSLPSGAQWLQENGSGDNASMILLLLIAGIMSIMFGLLVAGSWLTSGVSRLLSHRTRNVTMLLAGKRIAS